MTLTYGTFCSGIGAPERAWSQLGWRSKWCAEIEPFPSAVLAHHFPHTPNLGDITKIDGSKIEPVDVVCAGTPCQSFSVAGLRAGMDDPRGNLALVFLGIVDRLRPRWLVWENVPGVLSSSEGRDFGTFLGAVGQLGYGWAYRILDAQYFGVPQRRRRVFVVGYLGDWRRAAAVLFERHGFGGHYPPSREAWEGIAADVAPSLRGVGPGAGRTGDSRGQDPVVCGSVSSKRAKGSGGPAGDECYNLVTSPLTQNPYADNESRESLLVTHALTGEGFDASEDGTPIIPILEASKRCGIRQSSRDGLGVGRAGDPMFALQSNAQHAIAFGHNKSPSQTMRCDSETTPGLQASPCSNPAIALQPHIAGAGGVRRLMPVECERLQGFPDGWTDIIYKGKPAADSPRYRAIGNSMHTGCLVWIGERMQAVEAIAEVRA